MTNPVLVEVTRGDRVESRHRGMVVVVDGDGSVVFSQGDAEASVFPRSACKAMQALPGFEPELKAYRSAATSERTDAQVDTRILIQYKGIQAQGRGASTDIVESSVRAYVDAVNRLYRAAAAREIKLSDE